MTSLSTFRMVVVRSAASRTLSTHCVAAEKLRGVFEEYRLQKYVYNKVKRGVLCEMGRS
jgi:hypothetical protein